MEKPKVIIGVDNSRWCWYKTMQDMTYCLPEYDCTILSAHEFQKIDDFNEWDFCYFRGYANAFVNDSNIKKVPPFISTLTTGGQAIEKRMDEMQVMAKMGWGLIVQNKKAYHRCVEAGYDNVYIVPNGVNTEVYRPAEERPEMVFVGCAINTRDDRRQMKGNNFVTDAIKEMDGVNYAEASSKKPLNYEQMIKWYQALNIYAQPSESEGCSNSVMEAMSSGLPVLICEGVGYHGEVCSDGIKDDYGQVIFVKRETKDIKDKISMLLDSPSLYARISQNAREFALNHQWKHIAHKYKLIFDAFTPIALRIKINKLKYKLGLK